jgi:DNA-directed RNA polymerase subunit RPC12/RpoP
VELLCVFLGYSVTALVMGLTQLFVKKSEYKRNNYCIKCGEQFTFENPRVEINVKGNWICKKCSSFIEGGD